MSVIGAPVAPTSPEPAPTTRSLASPASITTALSIGWLLAELRLELSRPAAPTSSGSTAELLADVPTPTVRIRQMQGKLSLLHADFEQAGITDDDAVAALAELGKLVTGAGGAGRVPKRNGTQSTSPLPQRIDTAAKGMHANLIEASTRIGRAFALGFDLARTCQLPRGAPEHVFKDLFGPRVVDVQEALADLTSSLPDHAARGVSLSLAQWQHWAAHPKLSKTAIVWPNEGIENALSRQSQVWRTVLSGEKSGQDMLASEDYFGALKTLARRLVTGRPWVWLLLVGFVFLTGLGIFLLVTAQATIAKIGGVALSALGAVGISTASLKRGFSDVAKELEAQVWSAELDYAIAEAITVPPGDWRIKLRKIAVPPPRGLDPHIATNAHAVHHITHGVSVGARLLRLWKVQKCLDDRCRYEPLTGPHASTETAGGPAIRRRLVVARRLVKDPAPASDLQQIAPGAPGQVVSEHVPSKTGQGRAFVWTFRRGRLVRLQEFGTYDAARQASGLRAQEKSAAMSVPETLPPPVRHATDRQKLRRAEREVRRLLSPGARQRALQLSSRSGRLALHARRRGTASPDVFMPRDPYISLVQEALERRIEIRRVEDPARAAVAPGGPEAADGTSVSLGDQLFARFGPDDFGWMQTVVEAGLTALEGGKHAFGNTPTEQRLADRARLVLLADWGTGTPRARRVAELTREWLATPPGVERHVIHLGDVYYCGLPAEYKTRFLNDWPAQLGDGVTSWNLNGNHDMYSGGQGYFEVISHDPFAQQRGTSCFRLYNDHWQFIALDTAYLDNDLYDVQLPWLERWVGSGSSRESPGSPAVEAPRSVLLSHHQLGSALAQDSVGPGIRQKTQRVRDTGRIHAWFWGHEHRAFLYEPYLGVTCPVCLGNGGVPELLSHTLTLEGAFGWVMGVISHIVALFRGDRVAPPRIMYQPPTPDVDKDGLKWEKLGFVVIDVDGPSGQAVYVDENGVKVPIAAFGREAGARGEPAAAQ